MRNHLGEREYKSYAAWKRAILRIDPNATIEGDKDIACAFTDKRIGLGEWDGAIGVVYHTDDDAYIPKGF